MIDLTALLLLNSDDSGSSVRWAEKYFQPLIQSLHGLLQFANIKSSLYTYAISYRYADKGNLYPKSVRSHLSSQLVLKVITYLILRCLYIIISINDLFCLPF